MNHLLVTFTQFFVGLLDSFISISKSFFKGRKRIPSFFILAVNVVPSFSFAFDVTWDVFTGKKILFPCGQSHQSFVL